jgi:hypothetical protein
MVSVKPSVLFDWRSWTLNQAARNVESHRASLARRGKVSQGCRAERTRHRATTRAGWEGADPAYDVAARTHLVRDRVDRRAAYRPMALRIGTCPIWLANRAGAQGEVPSAYLKEGAATDENSAESRKSLQLEAPTQNALQRSPKGALGSQRVILRSPTGCVMQDQGQDPGADCRCITEKVGPDQRPQDRRHSLIPPSPPSGQCHGGHYADWGGGGR